MSGVTNRKFRDGSSYSVVYNNIRGVDFSGDGSTVSRSRLSYAENMYRDYEADNDGAIESIPGFRKIRKLDYPVSAIYRHMSRDGEESLIIHAGKCLYKLLMSEIDAQDELTPFAAISGFKSTAFSVGLNLYIIDGGSMVMIDEYGVPASVSDMGRVSPYVPTTYVNGEAYEQRNLMTSNFVEVNHIGSVNDWGYGNNSLTISIIDGDKKECKITGITDDTETIIYIPSKIKVGSEEYRVVEIEDFAFMDNTKIVEVSMANGVRRIGKSAFSGCRALKEVNVPDSTLFIDNAAFNNCTSLLSLYLGESLEKLGNAVFSGILSIPLLEYAKDSQSFQSIEGIDQLSNQTVTYNRRCPYMTISVPVNTPASSISYVNLNGESVQFTPISKDGVVSEVVIYLGNKNPYNNSKLELGGILAQDSKKYNDGFRASEYGGMSASRAIYGCTVAEVYDGRVFLTGNPECPNLCFYSSRNKVGENNPLYFGDLNYFADGLESYPNVAMLATSEALAVFKSDDDGGGSIFYHTPRETGIDLIPKIYPVCAINGGICAKGGAISFFDDPVFVSEHGISALEKKSVNLERSITTRSSNVNKKLLTEELTDAKLAVWQGYLVVATAGNMYLADSRQTFTNERGELEYEWFYLSGIGTYDHDARVYRYASLGFEGYHISEELADRVADGAVYSETRAGETYYFTYDGDKKMLLYPTEEKTGGIFCPPLCLLAVGKRLFFGTGNGDLCVFNNDKRGVAPDAIRNSSDYDEREYKEKFGRTIAPLHYSFANHRVKYAIRTVSDNGNIPHMLKNTVKNSLAVKCKATAGGSFICEVGTDSSNYRELCKFPAGALAFDTLDFGNGPLTAESVFTIPLAEKEKRWVEKQISLFSEEYCAPFGIYTIAYRFSINGGIKKK